MATERIEFDSPQVIAASIAVAIVGWAVFMGLPILVGALADTRGFSEEQVGYLASADLGGMFISSVLVSIFVSRMNRGRWILIGIVIASIANYIAVDVYGFYEMLGVRVIAGFGAGFCYSIALANLAATRQTARNFSYLIFTLVAVNFIELLILPMISDAWGVGGIFYTFIAINLLCLTTYRFWPKGRFTQEHTIDSAETEASADPGHSSDSPAPRHDQTPAPFSLPLLGGLCLLAIAMFYVTVGGFWAYIERMGVSAGLDDDFISLSLALTTLISLAGCYIAYRLSRNQGQSRPLIAALGLIALSLIWFGSYTVAFSFFAVLVIYQLLWNGIDIYQLGTLSNIDHSGRYPALVPAAQGLGQTIGPSLAGYMIGQGLGYGAVMYMCAATALGTALIYSFVYANLKRSAPAVADAA